MTGQTALEGNEIAVCRLYSAFGIAVCGIGGKERFQALVNSGLAVPGFGNDAGHRIDGEGEGPFGVRKRAFEGAGFGVDFEQVEGLDEVNGLGDLDGHGRILRLIFCQVVVSGDHAVFDFGNDATFSIASLLVTFAAWALWFLLAFWCVAFGTRSGRKRYLDIGVAAVGLGVVTRFFDLIGGQTGTGVLFVVGGLVLIGTAWGMEKWRRQTLARMGES